MILYQQRDYNLKKKNENNKYFSGQSNQLIRWPTVMYTALKLYYVIKRLGVKNEIA